MKALFLLLLVSGFSWSKPSPPTHQSLTSLMIVIRDPAYDNGMRRGYLQFAQAQMEKLLAKELNVTKENLLPTLMSHPEHLKKLTESPWAELMTEFYTTLHQQVILNRWQARSSTSKLSNYGQSLMTGMNLHLGNYSKSKNDLSYNRWHDLTVTKNDKKKVVKIPYFLFTGKIDFLLSVDAHTPYEGLLAKPTQETDLNPSLNTFLKVMGSNSRTHNQELAEKMQLNHRIYKQTISNGAKTVASVHYLTGEYSLSQTESKVEDFLNTSCSTCSEDEKEQYLKEATSYVLKTKKEFVRTYSSAKDIVQTFCSDLKENHYLFPELPKAETFKPYGLTQPAVRDNTEVDPSIVGTKIKVMQLNAIRKTVSNHDLGILFLTNSLMLLNSVNEPFGTSLKCHPEMLEQDTAKVKSAIKEASSSVKTYIAEIEGKIKTSQFKLKESSETLEYFTQTSVAATAEVLTSFPQGINHVIQTVLVLDHDVKRRKVTDTVVLWGGTAIGVACSLTGFGAPEGAAIIIATIAVTKGMAAGSYDYFRSEQEKDFYRQLAQAKAALGDKFYLNDNLQSHYDDYQSHRINYIVDFAGVAINFAHIHTLALSKTGGDIKAAHGLIARTLKLARASGEEVSADKIMGIIAQSVF